MRVSGLRVVVRVLDVRVRGDLWSRERNRLGPASLFRRIEVRVPGVQADEDPPWRERAPSAVAEKRSRVCRDNGDEYRPDREGFAPTRRRRPGAVATKELALVLASGKWNPPNTN